MKWIEESHCDYQKEGNKMIPTNPEENKNLYREWLATHVNQKHRLFSSNVIDNYVCSLGKLFERDFCKGKLGTAFDIFAEQNENRVVALFEMVRNLQGFNQFCQRDNNRLACAMETYSDFIRWQNSVPANNVFWDCRMAFDCRQREREFAVWMRNVARKTDGSKYQKGTREDFQSLLGSGIFRKLNFYAIGNVVELDQCLQVLCATAEFRKVNDVNHRALLNALNLYRSFLVAQ